MPSFLVLVAPVGSAIDAGGNRPTPLLLPDRKQEHVSSPLPSPPPLPVIASSCPKQRDPRLLLVAAVAALGCWPLLAVSLGTGQQSDRSHAGRTEPRLDGAPFGIAANGGNGGGISAHLPKGAPVPRALQNIAQYEVARAYARKGAALGMTEAATWEGDGVLRMPVELFTGLPDSIHMEHGTMRVTVRRDGGNPQPWSVTGYQFTPDVPTPPGTR